PVTVYILNQVRTTGFGPYNAPTAHYSSGGTAFEHIRHYRLYFDIKEKIWDEKLKANRGTKSEVSLEKSKFCPSTKKIEIYIDDTVGGKIRQIKEIQDVAIGLGIIKASGAWYYWADDWSQDGRTPKVPNSDKYHGRESLYGKEEVRQRCIQEVTRHFRKSYMTVDWTYREAGITTGEPS